MHKFPILYSSVSDSNSKIYFPQKGYSHISDYKNLSFKEGIPTDKRKELSMSIFQNNDVDLVLNLNPDSNNNLVSNLLFKEQLKNKLESKIINFKLHKKEKEKEGEKKEETKKQKEKKEEGDDEDGVENKTFMKKILKIKEFNKIEKDLNNKLNKIKQNYINKKQDKNKINNIFNQMLKEIDNIENDIRFLDDKEKENENGNPKTNDLPPKQNSELGKKIINFSLKNILLNKRKTINEINIPNFQ